MSDGSRHSMRQIAEATYGVTPATPAFKAIRHTGTTLGLSKDPLESAELRPDRQVADFRMGFRQVGGDLSVELSYGSHDDILEALLGGTWTANVLKAGVVRRSFTIERFFSDIAGADKPYYRYKGVEYNTGAFQINANAMVTAVFGVIGQDQILDTAIIAGATYPAATTTSPVDSFTGVLKEAGGTISVVTEIALNVDNGMAARPVVGSKLTIRPSQARSRITGQVTAYFENSALVDKFINETESSLEFDLPDGAGNNINVKIPRFKYTGGKPDVSGDGPITLAMPFQALLDSVTGTNIIITRTPAP